MTEENPLLVKSLGKAFQLLEVFGKSGEGGCLSHKEMKALSGLDASTVQRMSHTLLELDYLERGPNRTYMLGKKFLNFSFEYLRHSQVVQQATPILLDLQKETGERVDLSLFNDLTIIYAIRRQTKRQTFYATLIGRTIPTYASSGGRAMMAKMTENEQLDILDRSQLRQITPRTLTDKREILAAVQRAGQLGYALCVEEMMQGEIVLASPVVNGLGEPIAAIHVSGSLSEWNPDDFCAKHAPLAISAARAVSGEQGSHQTRA